MVVVSSSSLMVLPLPMKRSLQKSVLFAMGGFGSIRGRNSFQRKKEDAQKFLSTAMAIYEGLVQ